MYKRQVIIHTRSTDIEYYGKLQELSDMAGTDFFRTHRAYLVPVSYTHLDVYKRQAFLSSLLQLSPKRVVYISCNPVTQARDLKSLTSHGYRVEPVSYTHLDVYKRQVHLIPAINKFLVNPSYTIPALVLNKNTFYFF